MIESYDYFIIFKNQLQLYKAEKARKDQKKLLSVFLLGMMRIANVYNFADWNGTYSMFQNKPFGYKKWMQFLHTVFHLIRTVIGSIPVSYTHLDVYKRQD